MKKLGLLCLTVVAACVFTACDKNDLGVFKPKLKISNVYNETNGHYLQEKWTWNNDRLEQVDYYRKSGNLDYTHIYQYENNRLSSIVMDNNHTDFVYDGKKLTNIYTYEGDQMIESYALTYNKNKLSHISLSKKMDKNAAHHGGAFLQYLFPMDDPAPAVCLFGRNDDKEQYDFSAAEIDFVWEKDNVKYMKMTINRPKIVQKLTYTFLYDQKVNPKMNFFSLLVDHMLISDKPQVSFCSCNNVLTVYVTDESDHDAHTNSYTYSYDYYHNYPTKVYSTTVNDSTLLYSYQYQ
jgi:hypothetical protein